MFISGVNDTGDKLFVSGVIDTADKHRQLIFVTDFL
jgi:hypothetical protein